MTQFIACFLHGVLSPGTTFFIIVFILNTYIQKSCTVTQFIACICTAYSVPVQLFLLWYSYWILIFKKLYQAGSRHNRCHQHTNRWVVGLPQRGSFCYSINTTTGRLGNGLFVVRANAFFPDFRETIAIFGKQLQFSANKCIVSRFSGKNGCTQAVPQQASHAIR